MPGSEVIVSDFLVVPMEDGSSFGRRPSAGISLGLRGFAEESTNARRLPHV